MLTEDIKAFNSTVFVHCILRVYFIFYIVNNVRNIAFEGFNAVLVFMYLGYEIVRCKKKTYIYM